jgi:hypothetical protein
MIVSLEEHRAPEVRIATRTARPQIVVPEPSGRLIPVAQTLAAWRSRQRGSLISFRSWVRVPPPPRGSSSAGRAAALQAAGRRFEPGLLHRSLTAKEGAQAAVARQDEHRRRNPEEDGSSPSRGSVGSQCAITLAWVVLGKVRANRIVLGRERLTSNRAPNLGSVAQRTEQPPPKRQTAGSSPARPTMSTTTTHGEARARFGRPDPGRGRARYASPTWRGVPTAPRSGTPRRQLAVAQMAARLVWDQVVAGSSPASQTSHEPDGVSGGGRATSGVKEDWQRGNAAGC